MQEQKFEKQVRNKLEELSFTPSAPVWDKVEEQIRKKKDRKRFIFWLLPFILLSGSIYFFTAETPNEITKASKKIETSSVEKEINNRNSTGGHTYKNEIENLQAERHNNLLGEKVQQTPSVNHITITKTVRENFSNKGIKANTIEAAPKNLIASPKPNTSLIVAKIDTGIAIQNMSFKDSLTSKFITDSVVKAPPPYDTAIAKTSTHLIENALAKTKSKRRLEWGLYSSVGISNISTKPFASFSELLTAAKANRPATELYAQPSSAAQISSSRVFVVNSAPSPIRKNVAFSIGFNVAKKVTNRLTTSSGVHYNYLSTIASIGRKVQGRPSAFTNDSLANGFYLNNNLTSSNYVTRYHIIEIPVSIKWQIFKKNSLQLNSGFSFGQLVSTNALYYNAGSGIYYTDKSLFKNTQFSLFTGLSYPVLKFSKSSLWVGPKAQAQVSNLLKKKEYGQQHLYFGGITSYFSF